MTLNEKWSGLFGNDSSGTGMKLAHADPGGGSGNGGEPDLKVSSGPWTTASSVANALHTSSASALTELEEAAKVDAKRTEGFDSTAAMAEVLTSWKGRLTSVRDECTRLEGSLRSAGKEFGEQEIENRRRFEGRIGGPK
ncbi:hypothetical protein [Streptomyces sp. NPDC020681]|uniref:hypothetical protein n=1 Tax=Streptomyces sp. NPDC020681 TaxID=3365083 RepID=UPI00378871D1